MPGRVIDEIALREALAAARAGGRRIALTNGVFDLLHVGHLRSLRAARAEADLLVVGVNTDASVRALKPGRPLVSQDERAELVAALDPVDHVVLFSEPTADALLHLVRPDVYVKGGDYTRDTLPERPTLDALGIRLALIPLVPAHSTTALLHRLEHTA